MLLFALSCSAAEEQSKPVEAVKLPAQIKQEKLSEVIKAKIAAIPIVEGCDISQVMFNIVEAAKNKEVSGIVLNIDCSGGWLDKFSALHDLVKKVSEKKPVVGLVLGSALSGGYLVLSATTHSIAQSISSIGHIGSIVELTKYKEPKITGNLDAKLEVELFSAGEYKGIYHPYHTLSEKERAYIKSENEKVYEIFVKLVSENRNIDLKDSKKWADGKSYFAPDALKLGLIDEIGTIFEAEAKLLALISKKNPDIIFDNDCEYVFYDSSKNSKSA